MRWPWVLAGLALSPAALACGEAELQRAGMLGTVAFVLALGCMVAATWVSAWRGVVRSPFAAGWVLVLAHPAIWAVADPGDCGVFYQQRAFAFTTLTLGVLAWSLRRPLPAPPEVVEEDTEEVEESEERELVGD